MIAPTIQANVVTGLGRRAFARRIALKISKV
jgi:hypothetical protein